MIKKYLKVTKNGVFSFSWLDEIYLPSLKQKART